MNKPLFTVIYSFRIIKERETDFVTAWGELTRLIYQYHGSYGSRLHKAGDDLYIGYAEWPDRATWESPGNKLPESANEFRKTMKETCTSITTDQEMDVVLDLLKETPYHNS